MMVRGAGFRAVRGLVHNVMETTIVDDEPLWLANAGHVMNVIAEPELLRVKITKRPGDVCIFNDFKTDCSECHMKIFSKHDDCQVCNRCGVSGYKFKKDDDEDTCLSKMIKNAHAAGANIIVKAGPKAKWYLKRCRIENLDIEIERAKWGGSRENAVNRATMYIVDLN